MCVAGIRPFRNVKETTLPAYEKRPLLVKLHGDVASERVVAPTWSKGVDEAFLPFWREAYQILREATCVRFLGYSLPVGDSYFRFLVKAALADGRHTKEIDVVCLDPTGSVRMQYESFVVYNKMRFFDANVLKYLELVRTYPGPDVRQRTRGPDPEHGIVKPYSWLEDAHKRFVDHNTS